MLNLEDHLALLEKLGEKRSNLKNKQVNKLEKPQAPSTGRDFNRDIAALGVGKPNKQKRQQRSSGLPHRLSTTSTHPSNQQKITSLPVSMPNRRHYTALIGMRWSKNSCAYDSVFTPIYVQWCTNRILQMEFIGRMCSPEANLLIDGFVQYEAGQGSLEYARDGIW